MINGLFKKPRKATRVCRVQNIDPSRNIVAEMHTENQKDYKVCLCLAGKNVKTSFSSEYGALNMLDSYGIIYKNK